MSEEKVVALKYEMEEIGKHIKGSKKRHLWGVEIGERSYSFVIEESLMSNKTKLYINGKVFHQAEPHSINKCLYSHGFVLQGHQFNIAQAKEGVFELRIDNNLFTHLLQQRLNKQEFTKHEVEEEEFALKDTISVQQRQKITLTLPGMMKKKKQNAAQSENWGHMTEAFPDYFAQQSQPTTKQGTSQVSQLEEKKIEEAPVPSAEEFNTMQNMFKTVVGCGEYVKKEKEGDTPTYEVAQIPELPAINLQEFNTMQNLFATIAPTQSQSAPLAEQAPSPTASAFKGIEEAQKQTALSVKAEEFSTMQQLFATMNHTQSKQSTASPQASSINASDFNTMQQLFATMNMGKPTFEPIRESQNESESNISTTQAVPNASDFNTLQAMFATNMGVAMQAGPEASKVQLGGQMTMQKLFESNSGLQEMLQNSSKPNQSQDPLKVSAADFNTMQMLFATQGGVKENNPSH